MHNDPINNGEQRYVFILLCEELVQMGNDLNAPTLEPSQEQREYRLREKSCVTVNVQDIDCERAQSPLPAENNPEPRLQ